MTKIKNIKEVTEPLKEQILNGDVHTIDEMKACLKPLGYSDTINEAAINFILREFVMSKVSSDSMVNMDIVVDLLRQQLEITTKDIKRLKSAICNWKDKKCLRISVKSPKNGRKKRSKWWMKHTNQ